jgi:hypothetical protein
MIARLVVLILMISTWIACSPKLQTQYNNQKTVCIGATEDNKQYVKGWGIGDSYETSLKNAKKNALSDVIFSGLTDGSKSCETKPLVSEVNARERYRSFFDAFFQDNGDYKNFISNSNSLSKVNFQKGRGGDFIINVQELRLYLISNKIIGK